MRRRGALTGKGSRKPNVVLRFVALGLVLAMTGLFGAAHALAAVVRVGEDLLVPEATAYADNIYLIADLSATLAGRVANDAVLFGGREARVEPQAFVGADALLLGGSLVRVAGTTTQDLRAIGWRVESEGYIGGDLAAWAAEGVDIAPAARIDGDMLVWSAWGTVRVGGSVKGNAVVYAPRVVLAGTLAGTTTAHARVVEVLPGAKVAALAYPQGTIVTIHDGAEVHKSIELPSNEAQTSGWRWLFALGGLWVGMVLLAAVAARAVMPGVLAQAQAIAHNEFVWSAFVGALVVFGFFPLALSLTVSGVGSLVGLGLLGIFAFLFAMGVALVGVVGGALWRRRWLREVDPLDWRWVLIASFVGALLLFVPLIGWVVWVTLWFGAVGALAQVVWRRR